MTITVQPARNEFTANAGQTIFNYTFKIFSITDLNVYITPAGQDANDSTDLITAFTVSGVGLAAGGSITLTTPSTLNDKVTIVSNVPSNRTTDYQNNGDFRPDTVNDDFDRVVSIVKKIEDTSNRSILLQQSQQDPKPLSLPVPLVGKLLKWKSDLSGLENTDVSELSPTLITDDQAIFAFPTVNAAVISTNTIIMKDGRKLEFDNGTTGDVVLASSVTTNTRNIIQCTGVPTLAIKIRVFIEVIEELEWFVDQTLGTDAFGKGVTTGTGAYKTIQFAIDNLPEIFDVSFPLRFKSEPGLTINDLVQSNILPVVPVISHEIVPPPEGSTPVVQS